jgi:hypothetical protein
MKVMLYVHTNFIVLNLLGMQVYNFIYVFDYGFGNHDLRLYKNHGNIMRN